MRRILALLLAVSLLASPALAVFPSVSLVDNCTRANEGPPPTGWVTSSGTGLKIVSNRCVQDNTADFMGGAWNTSFGPNMECAAKIAQVPAAAVYHEVSLRQQTNTSYASDHYEIDIIPIAGSNNDTMEFWKQVATVFTQLGATVNLGADFAVNDVWGARMTGTTFDGYYNGTSIGTRTDSDISGAGYCNLLISPASPTLQVSGFYAGTYSSSVPRLMLLGVGP